MILCFLQNQWARDPESLQRMMDRYPHGARRRDIIKRLLFMGCMTGNRLNLHFGDLMDQMEFENVHPKVGGYSGACFGVDAAHVTGAIVNAKPQIIVAFGQVAGDAIRAFPTQVPRFYSPHPAARGSDVPARLAAVASQLRHMVALA